MKKSISTLCKLLLSASLLWAVPFAGAEEISGIPTDMTVYCHPAFPTIREDSSAWQLPGFDPLTANIVDFYNCDYGPSGPDDVSFPPLTEGFQESAKKTNTSLSFRQP